MLRMEDERKELLEQIESERRERETLAEQVEAIEKRSAAEKELKKAASAAVQTESAEALYEEESYLQAMKENREELNKRAAAQGKSAARGSSKIGNAGGKRKPGAPATLRFEKPQRSSISSSSTSTLPQVFFTALEPCRSPPLLRIRACTEACEKDLALHRRSH